VENGIADNIKIRNYLPFSFATKQTHTNTHTHTSIEGVRQTVRQYVVCNYTATRIHTYCGYCGEA